MSTNSHSMWKPALIGGAFMGVSSALPLVKTLNCACCSLVIAGGVLAAYFYMKEHPPGAPPITYGDGALVGLLSGLVGTGVELVVSIPFLFLQASLVGLGGLARLIDRLHLPPEVLGSMQRVEWIGAFGIGMKMLATVLFLFPALAFGALGGVLGVAIFQPQFAAAPAAATPPSVEPAPEVPSPEQPPEE